jgi:hypothetical protein
VGGAGDVELGGKASKLKQAGLIGRPHPGGELAPNTRSAKLKGPLQGVVNFTVSSPRRAENIFVTGAAMAAGVGIGLPKRAVKAAFPHVKFDPPHRGRLGITLAKIPRSDGGRFQVGVDAASKKVTSFGIPFIAFCEWIQRAPGSSRNRGISEVTDRPEGLIGVEERRAARGTVGLVEPDDEGEVGDRNLKLAVGGPQMPAGSGGGRRPMVLELE